MDKESRISVVIVNWNAGELLQAAIESIRDHHEGCVKEVVVVDNASSDGSTDRVSFLSGLPFRLRTVRNQENRGFAVACNQGAALCTSKYILFLNPDTRLHSDTLTSAFNFMEAPPNAQIGICGVRLVDDAGETCESAARFPTISILAAQTLGLDRLLPGIFPPHSYRPAELCHSRRVDQVIGAFFLIRSQLFRQCGGFDERFFVYYEEVDLSIRALHEGFTSYLIATTTAYHKGGGCSEKVKAKRLFYSLRSRLAYGRKHFGKTGIAMLYLLTIVELPARIARAAFKLSWSDAQNSVRGYLLLAQDVVTSRRSP